MCPVGKWGFLPLTCPSPAFEVSLTSALFVLQETVQPNKRKICPYSSLSVSVLYPDLYPWSWQHRPLYFTAFSVQSEGSFTVHCYPGIMPGPHQHVALLMSGALESSTPAEEGKKCGTVARKFCEQSWMEKTSLPDSAHWPGLVKVSTECRGGRETFLKFLKKEVELGESRAMVVLLTDSQKLFAIVTSCMIPM